MTAVAELERSAAPRNGLPGFRPYRYNGTGESIAAPQEITARLRRRIAAISPEHAALVADYGRRHDGRGGETMPDPPPGYEWYRELAEDGDGLAEMTAARDRYQEALAAVPDPEPRPAPLPVTAAARCRRCRYLTTSAGHRVMCGE